MKSFERFVSPMEGGCPIKISLMTNNWIIRQTFFLILKKTLTMTSIKAYERKNAIVEQESSKIIKIFNCLFKLVCRRHMVCFIR